MSYEVYITRAPDQFSTAQYPISQDEWLQLVESDPRLQTSETDYLGTKKFGRIYATIWLDCPDPQNYSSQLYWYNYAIKVENAGEEIIAKMVEIAEKLHANVIGQEGEFWTGEHED